MSPTSSRGGQALAVSLCMAAVALTPFFEPALAQQQPQPTFKVSVNVVDVDVTVEGRAGTTSSPVSPLKTSKCSKMASRRRFKRFPTSSFQRNAAASFAFGGRPVPADVRSNRDVESGRVYIIVLDDLNVAPLRTAHRSTPRPRFHRTAFRSTRSRVGGRHERPQGCRPGIHERPGAAAAGRRQLLRTAAAVGRNAAHRRLLQQPAARRAQRYRLQRTTIRSSRRPFSTRLRGTSRSTPAISSAASAPSAC